MRQIKFDAKFILKILLITLVINCMSLFIVDGPSWVFLCFTIWLNFLYILITLYFTFFVDRSKVEEKTDFAKLKPKWQKIIKYGLLTVFVVLLACIILIPAVIAFPYVFNPVMHWKAEQNKVVLDDLVNHLTEDCINSEQKTVSLLNWFERYSGNIYNIWGHPRFENFIFGDGKPYSCIFCVRLVEREPALWVLTSRCGACEEHSVLFREMANAAGLTVRSVICHGIDHLWDEVLINGRWIIVDPANVVFSRNMTGYNLSSESFERRHAGKTHNISYVFAEYFNRTKEDITYRYAGNLSFINISTVNEKLELVPNVDITVFSNNKFTKRTTGLSFHTDEYGKYHLYLGGGDVILESIKEDFIPLFNETNQYFIDGESYNLTIVLKEDWTRGNVPIVLVVCSIIIFILISMIWYFKGVKINSRL